MDKATVSPARILLFKSFGVKTVGEDSGCKVTAYHLFGKTIITDVEYTNDK